MFAELRVRSGVNWANYSIITRYKDLTWDTKYLDAGAITFTVPTADAVTLGLQDLAIVEVAPDGQTVDDHWYFIDGTSGTTVADDELWTTFSGKSLIALLDEARVYPQNWPTALPPGHSFGDVTPATAGTIMRTLVEHAQTRGTLTWLDVSTFTGTTNSNNTGWATAVSLTYENGTGLFAVLQDLAARGMVSWRMTGRTLKLYNLDQMVTNRTPEVATFRRGQAMLEQTTNTDATAWASAALVVGDTNVAVERTNATNLSAIGRRREIYVAQAGITDIPTLQMIGDRNLSLAHLKSEETLGVLDSTGPWTNYLAGDWVWEDRAGTLLHLQVVQIAASAADENGTVKVGLTLGDLIDQQDARIAKLLNNITNGGGAIPNPNVPVVPDTVAPAPPSGVALDITPYLDASGNEHCQITVGWNPPTLNSNGTLLTDLDHFDVQYTTDIGGGFWSGAVSVDEPVAHYSGLDCGLIITFRVRAVDTSGNASTWASSVATLLPHYASTPATPSTPTLTAAIRGVVVQWDGLTSTGAAYPTSWARTDVHLSTSSGFTPSADTLQGAFTTRNVVTGGGPRLFIALGTTSTYYAKLIAWDKSGNSSAASAQSTGVAPVLVTTTDITDLAVTGAKIADAAISATKILATARQLGGTITTTSPTAPQGPLTGDLWIDTANGNVIKQWTGATWAIYQLGTGGIADNAITAAKITADSVGASEIISRSITAAEIATGTITSNEIQAGTIQASDIGAGQISTAQLTVATFGDSVLANGSMEEPAVADEDTSTGVAHWRTAFTYGAPTVLRDTTVFAGGTASLKISLSNGNPQRAVVCDSGGGAPTYAFPITGADLWYVRFKAKASRSGVTWVNASMSMSYDRAHSLTLSDPNNPIVGFTGNDNANAVGLGTTPSWDAGVAHEGDTPFLEDIWHTYEGQVVVPMHDPLSSPQYPLVFGRLLLGNGQATDNLAVDVWIDDVQLAPIRGQAYIADASIGKAKIVDLSADAITSGTLTATDILSGTISGSILSAGEIYGSNVVVDNQYGGTVLVYLVTSRSFLDIQAPTTEWLNQTGFTGYAQIECWGAGGSGSAGGGYWRCGQGGCGGEYAREPLVHITDNTTYPVSIGYGGASVSRWSGGGDIGNPGGSTTFVSTDVEGGATVTAHGGSGAYKTVHMGGGRGSTNAFHFNGGPNDTSVGHKGGDGGGSSAGNALAGSPGHLTTGNTGASACTGPSASGYGGAGGTGVTSGTGYTAGQNGGYPGGGGGGGGGSGSTTAGAASGSGGSGRIRVTYGGTWTLVMSIAGSTGIDRLGNRYEAGVAIYPAASGFEQEAARLGNITNPGTWHPAFLVNGWSNSGGFNYAVASFHKDALGWVHVRGTVSGPGTSTTLPIFNLPIGFRPAGNVWVSLTSQGGNPITGLVSTSGNVYAYAGVYSGSPGWLGLAPICFQGDA